MHKHSILPVLILVTLIFSACATSSSHVYVMLAEEYQTQYHIDPTSIKEEKGPLRLEIDYTYRTRESLVSASAYVNFTLYDKPDLGKVTNLTFVFPNGKSAVSNEYRELSRNVDKGIVRFESIMSPEEFQKVLDYIDTDTKILITDNVGVHEFIVSESLCRKFRGAKNL